MQRLHVTGKLCRDDGEAYWNISTQRPSLIIAYPLGCVGLCVFWLLNREYQFGLIAIAIFCSYWSFRWWNHGHRARRNYVDALAKSEQKLDVTFDHNGVVYLEPNTRHEYTWLAFDDFAEDDKMLSLMRHGSPVLHVPKRMIASEDLLHLRASLVMRFRTTDSPAANAFPVVVSDDRSDAQ